MHKIVRSLVLAAGLATLPLMMTNVAVADDTSPQAHWAEISKAIFGKTPIASDNLVKIAAPTIAQEASLVPITLSAPPGKRLRRLYFVIDENPSPLAAKFTFGPASDPSKLSFRVRVDTFTNLHAVAETEDGSLHESTRYLKASGGCSTVIGVSEQEAMQGMGFLRFKRHGEAVSGKPLPVTLMVMHPNFNGMQMNDITGKLTPARFIRSIRVSYNDKLVFQMESDLSISTNPVLNFSLVPDAAKGEVRAVVEDSQNARWEQRFEVPASATN